LQSVHVEVGIAAELELEVTVAISGDDLLERLRQAIAGSLTRVVRFDRVKHAYRMPRRDAVCGHEAGKKAIEIDASEVRGQRCVDSRRIAADRRVERN